MVIYLTITLAFVTGQLNAAKISLFRGLQAGNLGPDPQRILIDWALLIYITAPWGGGSGREGLPLIKQELREE